MRQLRHSAQGRLRRTLVVVPAATSLAAIGTFGTATPADAGNGDAYKLDNLEYGCLTTDDSGFVYVRSCSNDYRVVNYQRWMLWFGGFTKNVKTGDCLTLLPGSSGVWQMGTRDCGPPLGPNPYQEWQQWDAGWIRNPFDGACVSTDGYNVYATDCTSTLQQLWDQQLSNP